jgi:hypothetical protein
MDLDLMAAPGTRNININSMILRTRSLDEPTHSNHTLDFTEHSYKSSQEHFDPADLDALHSSFDNSSIFNIERERQHGAVPSFTVAASWDENDQAFLDGPGRKHVRTQQQQQHSIQMPELPRPGAVRQSSRRSIDESGLSKTPVGPRFRPPGTCVKKTVGKLTPASAKRHRAPLQRRSPMRRVPPKTPRDSSSGLTPHTAKHLQDTSFGRATHTSGDFGSFLPTTLDGSDLYGANFSNKKPSKPSFGTVATVASSTLLETTTETADSVDTSDTSAPLFRFTSFPASLPRINNVKTVEGQCPGTVRKRMFGDPLNASLHDDGTHNSSMSSLQDDGQYAYSDDESAPSPIGTPVARTRLNFNTVLSPLGTFMGRLENQTDGMFFVCVLQLNMT